MRLADPTLGLTVSMRGEGKLFFARMVEVVEDRPLASMTKVVLISESSFILTPEITKKSN